MQPLRHGTTSQNVRTPKLNFPAQDLSKIPDYTWQPSPSMHDYVDCGVSKGDIGQRGDFQSTATRGLRQSTHRQSGHGGAFPAQIGARFRTSWRTAQATDECETGRPLAPIKTPLGQINYGPART